MMEHKQLLVGVDFSPCSLDALREAVRIANLTNARLSVVHVIDGEVMDYLRDHSALDEKRTKLEAQYRLDHFVGMHSRGCDEVETLLRVGHPFGELVHVCEELGADILLLGSHGRGGDHGRVGAIASMCLRKAPAPVLLVQDRSGQPFKQVVCGVDYSPTAALAVRHAIQMAKIEGAALDFLHVYASPFTYRDSGTGYYVSGLANSEDFERIMKQNLSNYLTAFQRDFKGLSVTQTVRDRLSAGQGIIDRLREVQGDLLVLGTRGRSGWKKLLLGTTAEHIVHRAPCSVLAVKPEDYQLKSSS